MKNGMKKTAIGTALWATLFLTMGVSLSACSSDKEEAGAESGEVLAKDKVDEASELARANAPEAEDMDFPETAPMPAADTAEGLEDGATGTDTAVAEDGTAADTAVASADTDAATTDSAAATDTDAAATTTDTTEPATN
ncbi:MULTISPECIES: hypothetical protein [unclassified Psychrobacter]|uniref:hypothetical protein n=1 Tax=unclassified Psychrobacter TaxID=196806 RepID=UPI0025DC4876|nr:MULTISPECIES: hypothetical protein [unclassified Psychrobacter]